MKASVRAATFIEYAILGAISVAIGGVILSLINPGMFSSGPGGKRLVTTTTLKAVHHGVSGSSALGNLLWPAVFLFGGVVLTGVVIRLLFKIAAGSSKIVTVMNERTSNLHDITATLDSHNERIDAVTTTLRGTLVGADTGGTLAGVGVVEKPLVHQFVGPATKRRRVVGQPKFR